MKEISSSRPVGISTSPFLQLGHSKIGPVTSYSWKHPLHTTITGTSSISSRAPPGNVLNNDLKTEGETLIDHCGQAAHPEADFLHPGIRNIPGDGGYGDPCYLFSATPISCMRISPLEPVQNPGKSGHGTFNGVVFHTEGQSEIAGSSET